MTTSSIDQIISDWWHTVAPDNRLPRNERLACYIDLFMQIKEAGHERGDIMVMHKNDVIKRSVNQNYKNKKNLRLWEEMARADLERAEFEVYAEAREVSEEAHEKATAIKTEEKAKKKSDPSYQPKVELDEPDEADYVLFKPDTDNKHKAFSMDYIEEKFDFELDPDRIEKLKEDE